MHLDAISKNSFLTFVTGAQYILLKIRIKLFYGEFSLEHFLQAYFFRKKKEIELRDRDKKPIFAILKPLCREKNLFWERLNTPTIFLSGWEKR